MIRQRRRNHLPGRKTATFRPTFEMLETRVLLSADTDLLTFLYVQDGHPAGCGCACCGHGLAAIVGAAPAPSEPAGGISAAGVPLTSIPALNSLPGARASIYLDFNGHFEATWGAYSNVSTPAFDQDGDAATFSDAELTAIQQIWRYVAEDYAPFNINVTTVQPSSFADGLAMRIAVGGNGAWTGATYGGIGYIGSFTNSIVNTAFVFAKNLGNGNAKYVGDAAAHEAAHAFGLRHQSEYSGTTKVSEYYRGPGDGRAPLLGNSYTATRSLWWYGPTTSSTTIQDDMAVIASSTNGFGYRADDHGSSISTARVLTVSGSQVSASGVITHHQNDPDYFSFSTGAGTVSFAVSVPSVNNLDARLELRSASGAMIAAAAPSNSFGASLSATVSAGTYYVVVTSQGNYGDVGQYTLSGTVIPGTPPAAPSNLTATAASSSQINLAWTDNAGNETSYQVERSLNGSSWSVIATLSANSRSLADTSVSASTTYYYRVRALNSAGASAYSNPANARTLTTTAIPAAPTSLTAVVVSATRVDLSWRDNSNNELRFVIQRSSDGGRSWSTMGRVWENLRTFSDLKTTGGQTYLYRVYAENAIGNSGFSNLVTVVTPSASPAPPSSAGALSPVELAMDHIFSAGRRRRR